MSTWRRSSRSELRHERVLSSCATTAVASSGASRRTNSATSARLRACSTSPTSLTARGSPVAPPGHRRTERDSEPRLRQASLDPPTCPASGAARRGLRPSALPGRGGPRPGCDPSPDPWLARNEAFDGVHRSRRRDACGAEPEVARVRRRNPVRPMPAARVAPTGHGLLGTAARRPGSAPAGPWIPTRWSGGRGHPSRPAATPTSRRMPPCWTASATAAGE